MFMEKGSWVNFILGIELVRLPLFKIINFAASNSKESARQSVHTGSGIHKETCRCGVRELKVAVSWLCFVAF